MLRTRTKLLPLLVAGVGLLGACATEPPPLDRTQPEAVPKAIFQGDWYYNMTVTDSEYDNNVTFIGEQTMTFASKAFNLRWEVTKDRLNAHMLPQVYLDPNGNPITNPYGQSSIVLSFAINKHYDIRYRYNSTTREELNVLEENTDRPWDQREYMEIDWSKNLATNIWNPTQMDVTANTLEREDVASYDNVDFFRRGASKDEDVRIDTRKWRPTDGEVYVMNIDTKESMSSKVRSIYQIWYGQYHEPTTVRFRHSLMRIPPADQRTYKPLEYRDEFFRRFGFFRTEYEVKDPTRWDATESGKKYLINRWDTSEGKQIVWYISPMGQEAINAEKEKNNGQSDLLDWSKEVVDTWNKVLKEATGRADDVTVVHENEPLLDANGNQLARRDGSKRWKYELGDLRYPMINIVMKQGGAQPLGYGPSVPDANTGEILHANMNLYAGWCEFVVRRALDQYDVAAGNCTLDDIKNGRYFDPAKNKCCAGDPLPPLAGPEPSEAGIATTGAAGGPVPAGSQKPYGSDLVFLSPALKTAYWPKTDPAKPISQEFIKEIASGSPMPKLKALYDNELKHRTQLDLKGFKTIAGTQYESQLLPNSTILSSAPYGEGPNDPEVLAALSPASRLANLDAYKQQMIKEMMFKDEPIMFEPAIHAFVQEMKGKKRSEVERTLRHWIYYTGMLHEMGHNLGLRHNFNGSVDERNFPAVYAPEKEKYWTEIQSLRTKYAGAIAKGDSTAYEAYVRAADDIPSTKDRYSSSSIMDYHGDWMDWSMPARAYDRAALNFGYGLKVETKDASGKWAFTPYKNGDFDQKDLFDANEKAASGRSVRTYMFCSDEKTFDDVFCTQFDRGTTATEIVRNYIRDAQVAYFFSNFKRDRAGFDSMRNGYYWRKFMRHYYMMVKALPQLQINSMRYPEFWSSIWDGVNNIATAGPESKDMAAGYTRKGGEDLLRASLLSYYYLIYDVLGRPNYGYYSRKVDTSGNRYWEETDARFLDNKATNVFVDAGAGWGFVDRWDVQADSKRYYEHMQRIGVETDKILAYEVLSIPAALNTPLYYEKANGLSFWNSLWTNNGVQLWEITRGLVADNFSHTENPWCMKCDAACRADPGKNPPVLKAYPVDYLEGLARGGIFSKYQLPTGKNRCSGPDEEPVQPSMDALFAIKPMFYAIAGASHPWYHNALVEKLDSQVKGGLHRFDIPAGADTVEFVNPSGTKTYQAVQSTDGQSISYRLVDNARKIRNRVLLATACNKKTDPGSLIGTPGTFNRTCADVVKCYPASESAVKPSWCDEEGWDGSFALDMVKWNDVQRAEAMLIMMSDMIDIAGHYAWRVPGFLGGD